MLHSGHESLQHIPTYVAKSYWTCLAEILVLIISPLIQARYYHGVIGNEQQEACPESPSARKLDVFSYETVISASHFIILCAISHSR